MEISGPVLSWPGTNVVISLIVSDPFRHGCDGGVSTRGMMPAKAWLQATHALTSTCDVLVSVHRDVRSAASLPLLQSQQAEDGHRNATPRGYAVPKSFAVPLSVG